MKWNRHESSSNYFRILLSCSLDSKRGQLLNYFQNLWNQRSVYEGNSLFSMMSPLPLRSHPPEFPLDPMRNFLSYSTSQPESPFLSLTPFIPSYSSSVSLDNLPVNSLLWTLSPSPWLCTDPLLSYTDFSPVPSILTETVIETWASSQILSLPPYCLLCWEPHLCWLLWKALKHYTNIFDA